MLHKRSQSLLICGLVLTLGVLTACSSPEAVQANAPVMSSGVTTTDPNSGVPSSSSEIVSSLASSVSSAVSSNSGVTSNPNSGTNSTSNQAPTTSKPNSGTVSTKPASKPTSTPTKPASKPTSTAPASKPVSTAPETTAFNAKYYNATYGAEDASQYKEILSYAGQVTGRSRFSKSYDFNKENQSGFEDYYGVPYSDDANKVASIIGCFQNSAASGSHGNAYIAYTQGASNCGDDAKAIEAAMHVAGYNCKLVWGRDASGASHMWTSTYFDGAWHEWGRAKFSNGTPAGYSTSGSGYNY